MKVHLNSFRRMESSPYRRGKVCQSSISTITKIKLVTTIWMGYIKGNLQ
jgi:hypothetical protein